MKIGSSVRKSGGAVPRAKVWALSAMLAVLADVGGVMATGMAQNPYSSYIPTAVPTATVTLYTNGATAISPGRIGVDKAGNTFYIGHVSGANSTLYEIPATGVAGVVSVPTPLISGLGQTNSNSAFVDAKGTLWVSNGGGSGGSLIEVPAASGIPNTTAITGSGSYSSSTGLALTNIATACSSTSTTACTWAANTIGSSLTSLQIGDIFSDGAGNLYLVDVSDSVSSGAYNRVIQFQTSAPGTITVLADKLASNSYAQVTVAGDSKVYYCNSVTGSSSGGLVSLVSNGSITTVANTAAASLTLKNLLVEVLNSSSNANATGIAADPWGNLIISGPEQISEVPLESGVLNFVDQFNLLIAVAGDNAPMATNNVVYGGTFDVHGSYYYATTTNIMQVQVNGYNFGKVNVGTLVSTAAPYLNITWSLPSELETSLVSTSSPSTLSAANAAYLQSFPYGGAKSYFGGTPYGVSNTGQYSLMYFQPVHPGQLRGAISPQGFSNSFAATDSNSGSDFYMNGAYIANLQGVGVGPQPMFVPGTASQAVNQSQLYTSYSQTAKAVGFTPSSMAVDSFGDIFVTDTANTSVDLDCLATTANTAQNYRAGAAGNGYANSYCLTNGLAATNGTNLAGVTFKVSATGVGSGVKFPTSFVNPVDVVVDGINNAYVLDSGSNTTTVTKMPYATMIPSVVIPSNTAVAGTLFSNPMGLAIDGYGNLYIADTGNNRIVQARLYNAAYAQSIVYVPSTTTFGGILLSGPTGLGIDASGDLFIADTGNHRIVEYSVTGVASAVSTTGVTLVNPTSVKALASGALVVADSTLGLVLVDNGVGSLLSTGSISLSSTQGLALDFAGNIYVADPTGAQVVELNVNSPATATAFPLTFRGTSTSSETSYVYNSGNATLSFSAAPTVADITSPSANEFSVGASNGCTASATVAAGSFCNLTMNFTPAATAAVYTPTIGAATLSDTFPSYTLIADPAYSSMEVGSFGATGSAQTVTLTGQATTTLTPQAITFTTAQTSKTWTGSTLQFAITATGGPSGQPITFTILSGSSPVSLTGATSSSVTLNALNIGSYVIAANQAGAFANGIYYGPATQVTETIVVNPIGIVATPTFSVPAGVYTAAQSVTISDATPGATIYYTTNGNTPTPSSPVYTAGTPIPVNVTTTIKALATGAPGYSNSPIATAVYTLNPDFTFYAYQTSFNIPNGLAGSTTITVTPLFGFLGSVSLSCSGLYNGDSCNFLSCSTADVCMPSTSLTIIPATPTDPTGIQYGTVQILASESAALHRQEIQRFAPISALAMLLFASCFRRRRRLMTVMFLMLSAVGASMMTGCSDPSTTGRTHTTSFSLTATSGSVVHTITITLDVNNL